MNNHPPIPNLFLVGAAKSGTTSLYEHLARHPDIYMCPIKEPHHYCTDINCRQMTKGYLKGIERHPLQLVAKKQTVHIAHVSDNKDYLSLFKDGQEYRYRCECSNGYLFSSVAATQIHAASPNARILMILRHPVDRIISHFVSQIRISRVRSSLFDSVQRDFAAKNKGWGITNLYVEKGMYSEQVRRYISVFGKDQIHIELFDDWRKDCHACMTRIFRFLDLPPSRKTPKSLHVNKGRQPISPVVNEFLFRSGLKQHIARLLPSPLLAVGKKLYYRDINKEDLLSKRERQCLCSYFQDDITALESLLSRDLSAWRT
jgi:hypothetical protein